MSDEKYIIGIDPDTKGCGVCLYKEDGSFNLFTEKMMPIIFRIDKMHKLGTISLVCMSAGWLNKVTNFQNQNVNVKVREKISERVGANHEIGKQIIDYCHTIGVPYVLVRPRGKKLNAEQFRRFSGYNSRCNQDERDAAMTVFAYRSHRVD